MRKRIVTKEIVSHQHLKSIKSPRKSVIYHVNLKKH